MKRPVPSHHGHVTRCGDPPRFEITCPVPRHGAHSRGWGAPSPPWGASAAMSGVRLPAAAPRADTPVAMTFAPDGRFAPSPTGTLHLGNLRTGLLAWLFARSQD